MHRGEHNAAKENGDAERISREELYQDVSDSAKPTAVWMTMVALSAVVAAVGQSLNAPPIAPTVVAVFVSFWAAVGIACWLFPDDDGSADAPVGATENAGSLTMNA